MKKQTLGNMKAVTAVTFSLLVLMYETNACNNTDDIFPCTCALNAHKVKVDCSGYGLRSVPENLPERTAVLDFSDNLLQPDSIETICGYGYLEHVSIAGNHLTSIGPRRLRRCDISESLNFSGNPLDVVDKYTLYGLEFTHEFYGLEAREFKENSFKDMFGLKTLEMLTHQGRIPAILFKSNYIRQLKLNVNGATDIPESLLSPLDSTLVSFTLRSLSIQTMPANLLSNLKKLKQCTLTVKELQSLPSTFFQHDTLYDTLENISISGIKSLPRYVFWLLGNLRHLEIHGALDMPSDLFHGLLGLESLDLSTSTVSVIPSGWFKDLWSLQTLTLHDVGLTHLRKDDFKDLHALMKLDISKNRLRSLNSELFHYISGSAKFINISKNILKTVPGNLFKQHAVLECLDISKNQIYSVENGAFYHLSELKRLHLQSNKLYKLEADTFVYNVNMTYLDMSSNILIDLPGGLFASTHRLVDLNLSDNRLNKLERSIAFYIPSLRELNLSYNPIECDCEMIEAVKKLLLNVLIIGDCENPQAGIAIVNFVPDANCMPKSNTSSFVTRFISSTDFLYPSESIIDEWESKLITSANYDLSEITHDSKLPTIAITSVDVPYSNQELTASRINNFTIFKHESSKVKLNDLPITKHKVSDSAGFITVSLTPTPGYSTSASKIKKSSSVTGDNSQVYPSDYFADFKVNETKTDDGNFKSRNLMLTFATVAYKTDTVYTAAVEQDVSFVTTYTLETELETYAGTTYPTISPDATLEPSFKTASATSHSDNGIYLTETFSETSQTKSVLSENVESISPTSVYISELKDDKTMTDGFHTSGETIKSSPNATALPPVAGFANITGDPNMAENLEKSDYFYLSLASIVSVAVFSVLILVFLYYKRRRNSEYEVERRRDVSIFNLDDSFHEDGRISPSASCPMKEVPSIQIESVDDDGNVKLEFYPVSQTST